MRWTRMRCRRAAQMRTAKSCGPDAAVLASSLREEAQATVAKEPITGESTKETVKTIARGMPGDPGVTVVTNARVLYPTRAAAGALGARHSLRPLISWAKWFMHNSGASRREIEELCLVLAV